MNAGSYDVAASAADPNYQGVAMGVLTIGKATASVTLGSLQQVYDGTAKPATATTVPANLSLTWTYNGGPDLPVNAGSYDVAASVADPNYQGVAMGVLTIGKATASVTLGSLQQVYDGTAKSATAATIPPNLSLTWTYDGGPDFPVGAGSYAVEASVTDPNYQGGASGVLLIGKAAATVTLSNLQQVYDGTPKPVTVVTLRPGLASPSATEERPPLRSILAPMKSPPRSLTAIIRGKAPALFASRAFLSRCGRGCISLRSRRRTERPRMARILTAMASTILVNMGAARTRWFLQRRSRGFRMPADFP